MLGKIKCWHGVHKRVAVPVAHQLDVTINPVQKHDLCLQIPTSGKRQWKAVGYQRYPPLKQSLSWCSLANWGFHIWRTLLVQYRKDPGVLTSTGYEQHSQLSFPLARGRGSQGFMQVHSFLLKKGFVVISSHGIKSCGVTEWSLNPSRYSIPEHFTNHDAITTQLVWPQALGSC